MFAFLENQYRLSNSDDLGSLLGSMSLLPDGRPADPALSTDWEAAVQAALSDQVDARMRVTDENDAGAA
jgi:hypothetical protein